MHLIQSIVLLRYGVEKKNYWKRLTVAQLMQKQTKGYEDPFYDSFEVKLGRAIADLDNKAALRISETDLWEGCLFCFVGFF